MKENKKATAKEICIFTESSMNNFISGTLVGDVLQVRERTSSNKTHSVIVTDKIYDKKNSRWDIKIAYHSNDNPPVDFRTVSWQKFGGESAFWTRLHFK